MSTTSDPLQGMLDLFSGEPENANLTHELPGQLHLKRDSLWRYHEKGWPSVFVAKVEELAAGNWLFQLRCWESELVKTENQMRAFRILLTIAALGAVSEKEGGGTNQRERRERCIATLKCNANSDINLFRAGAIVGLAELGCGWALNWSRLFLRDGRTSHYRKIIMGRKCGKWDKGDDNLEILEQAVALALGKLGEEDDWHFLLLLAGHNHEEIRLNGESAITMLHSRVGLSPQVAETLIQRLTREKWVNRSGSCRHLDIATLLLLKKYSRKLFPDAIERFVIYAKHNRLAKINEIPELIPQLSKLATEKRGWSSGTALLSLADLDLPHTLSLIQKNKILCSSETSPQQVALMIVDLHSPTIGFLNDIILCSKWHNSKTRCLAAGVLGRLPAQEAMGELLCMLSDEDKMVTDDVRNILKKSDQDSCLVKTVQQFHGQGATWEAIRQKSLETLAWGEEIGKKFLGKQVLVFTSRNSLGWTTKSSKDGPAVINVSEKPFLMGLPHGQEITKALILHELAHHAFDFSCRGHAVVFGQVEKRGLGDLFNLICDERIERKMRSTVPGSGKMFDRLAAYAFCRSAVAMNLKNYAEIAELPKEEVAQKIQSGQFPGRLSAANNFDNGRVVWLNGVDMVSMPGYEIPFMHLALILRAKYPRSEKMNAKALAAIDLIPAGLKNLNHHEIMNLCQKIAELVGYGSSVREQINHLLQKLDGSSRSTLRSRWIIMTEVGCSMDSSSLRAIKSGLLWHNGSHVWRNEYDESQKKKKLGSSFTRKNRKGNTIHVGANLDNVRSYGKSVVSHSRIKLWNNSKKEEFGTLRVESFTRGNIAFEPVDPMVGKHARVLGHLLENIAGNSTNSELSWYGHRLDPASIKPLIYHKNLKCMVKEIVSPKPKIHLGLVIDRSASMYGEGINKAMLFGQLICSAVRGKAGIQGHIGSFDDETYYDMGTLAENNIRYLTVGGANNDAAALLEEAKRCPADPSIRRVLIMISDGLPTECSTASLRNLVLQLEGDGFVVVQVAVAELKTDCFRNFVDLSQYPLGTSVARFGRLLRDLVR